MDTDDYYRGYVVKVFIPEVAPAEVIDIVFTAIADTMSVLEDNSPIIRDRVDWDFQIEGESADHRLEAQFTKVVEENARLRAAQGDK